MPLPSFAAAFLFSPEAPPAVERPQNPPAVIQRSSEMYEEGSTARDVPKPVREFSRSESDQPTGLIQPSVQSPTTDPKVGEPVTLDKLGMELGLFRVPLLPPNQGVTELPKSSSLPAVNPERSDTAQDSRGRKSDPTLSPSGAAPAPSAEGRADRRAPVKWTLAAADGQVYQDSDPDRLQEWIARRNAEIARYQQRYWYPGVSGYGMGWGGYAGYGGCAGGSCR